LKGDVLLKTSNDMEQATTNTGVLHCAQDDGFKTNNGNGVKQTTTTT
jgi:hypothetical protein